MVRRFYAMKDGGEDTTPLLIDENQATIYNNKKYGIFQEVNSFNGTRRANNNISHINYWYAEIDGGDKDAQKARLKKLPIYPSIVVESKNGLHVYFRAKDATIANYKLVQDGLGEFLGGDPQVRDLARILRAPNYFHWKDENDPYLVKTIFVLDVSYREKEMLYFFPVKEKDDVRIISQVNPNYFYVGEDDLTGFLNVLDHEKALMALSGSQHVNFEKYTFKPVAGGKLNIIVNGESTNCFIDQNKKIGAVPGGPTLFQWLRYYGHSDKECLRIIKDTVWR